MVVISWLKPVAQPIYSYVKDFDVKSGYVEYHNYYNEPESTIKFWWNDYGQKYREEFMTNGRINAINLADGSSFYTLNMQTRQGNKVEAGLAAQVQEYYANLHFTNLRGSENVLGYECQISETAGIITSSYKGIPLRVGEAPGGWRIATDEDWQQLELFLGVPEDEIHLSTGRGEAENVGGKLKSKTGWDNPNQGATNESGFAAFPGGMYGPKGDFHQAGHMGFWWTSSMDENKRVWFRFLYHGFPVINREKQKPNGGLTVRIIRD